MTCEDCQCVVKSGKPYRFCAACGHFYYDNAETREIHKICVESEDEIKQLTPSKLAQS